MIFTSLMFFTFGKCCSGAFLPQIDPVFILGDSTVSLSAPPSRLVVSTVLCFCIHYFMFFCWIAGPVGTQKSHFAVNAGSLHRDSVSMRAQHSRVVLITCWFSQGGTL